MISIVIPAYNEELSIKETLEKIISFTKSFKKEIIVVDDGSTDNTSEILKKIKDIKIVSNLVNKGYGYSLKKAILEAKGEWIMIIDADSTYPPESIPLLLRDFEKYDMIVGSRTGANVNIPLLRKPAKWIVNKFANYISQEKIPDLNSGFRIFKKEIALRFFDLFPDNFSFTTTITMACLTNGYSVKYVPIDYSKRKKGSKSSIKPLRDFFGFLSLITRMSVYFRPMKIFGPVGGFLLFAGLVKGFFDFFRLGYFGSGNVMVVLAGFQILFLGLLADLVIKRTKL